MLGLINSASADLIITDIQIAGDQTDNDYVKIYNEGEQEVVVSGFRLRKKSSSGQEYSIRVFPKDTNIPAKDYLIWANSRNEFAEKIGAHLTSTSTLSKNNSVALVSPDGQIISAVAWGEGSSQFIEGTVSLPNPESNQQIMRKLIDEIYQSTQSNIDDFYLTGSATSLVEMSHPPSIPLRRKAQSPLGLILAAIIVSLSAGKLFTFYYQDNFKIS